MLITLALVIVAQAKPPRLPSEEEVGKITAAAPEKPTPPPARPRKLLVLGHNSWHDPVPYCAKTMEILARKTGAFEAVVTDDGGFLEPGRLNEFDALLANNWHGFDPFLGMTRKEFDGQPQDRKAALKEQEARRRKAVLDFVAGGKGLAGIHAATVGLNDWKEWGEMIGGRYAAL